MAPGLRLGCHLPQQFIKHHEPLCATIVNTNWMQSVAIFQHYKQQNRQSLKKNPGEQRLWPAGDR